MWGKTAELVCKHFNKGTKIAIEGKLTSRSYDAKDGSKKYITEIIMNEFMFVGSKKEAKSETVPF